MPSDATTGFRHEAPPSPSSGDSTSHRPRRAAGRIVERGEFPFPLTEGTRQSPYLVWIRNHANYMASGGPIEYLSAGAVTLRGIVLNALVGLPAHLLLAVAVATLYVYGYSEFYVTPWVLGISALICVCSALLGVLNRMRRFERSLETGSTSDIEERARWLKFYGLLLLVMAVVPGLEALPVVLGSFHMWLDNFDEAGWIELGIVAACMLGLYIASQKLMSTLGGVAKAMFSLVVASLGVILPILLVLFVAEYLVFTRPVWWWPYLPLASASPLILGFVIAAVYSWRESKGLLGRIAASLTPIAMALGILVLSLVAEWRFFGHSEQSAKEAEVLVKSAQNDSTLENKLETLRERAVANPRSSLKTLDLALAELRVLRSDTEPERFPSLQSEAHPIHELARVFDDSLDEDALRSWLETSADDHESNRHDVGTRIHAFMANLAPSTDRGPAVDYALNRLDISASSKCRQATVPWLPITVPRESMSGALAHAMQSMPRNDMVHSPDAKHERRFSARRAVLTTLPAWPLARAQTPAGSKGQAELRSTTAMRAIDSIECRWGQLLDEVRLEILGPAVFHSLHEDDPFTGFGTEILVACARAKMFVVAVEALLILIFCWCAVNINLTSLHCLYRDRLARAFLIRPGPQGDDDVCVETDLNLGRLCDHDAGSVAPYHLINAAINLQQSPDPRVRDRKCDFFVFSKLFIGGARTGYCREERMERAFPELGLSTAMAISAAAASPNMGRATSSALTPLLTFLNVRLGVWIPNPGILENWWRTGRRDAKSGIEFSEVFRAELDQVRKRWHNLPCRPNRSLLDGREDPTVRHSLCGLAFSGGGIRSATLNLGIVQALHQRGVFEHFDFMSTVSGGGYLGSSISALMRQRDPTKATSADPGIDTNMEPEAKRTPRRAKAERSHPGAPANNPPTFLERFEWRVRPYALIQEMFGLLSETGPWINVSDGGHIENLAAIELLRRRCKLIVIGDAEADPDHHFQGLATLIRTARIDLGIDLEIDVDALRRNSEDGNCARQWAIGRIRYPEAREGEAREVGQLLYFKSSLVGNEDEVIRQYRAAEPSFPHETTADQNFSERQFEAYRSLGQHMAEAALKYLPDSAKPGELEFPAFAAWFAKLEEVAETTNDRSATRRPSLGRGR